MKLQIYPDRGADSRQSEAGLEVLVHRGTVGNQRLARLSLIQSKGRDIDQRLDLRIIACLRYNSIEHSAKGRERWISVGTTSWLAANLLPPAIKQFRKRRRELHVRLFDGWLDKIQQRVRAGKLDMGVGIFKSSSEVWRSPLFHFALMAVFPDQGAAINSTPTRWSSLSEQRLISLTKDYPHQLVIDKQLAKASVICSRGQIVKLLETQIALVEANEGIAVIPSFGMLACRNRKVTMSVLVDPVADLDFYQISNRGTRLSEDAKEFSGFLKTYIANWAGASSIK
jgi:LysR family carnitine catabolism transcriptional activator